MKACIFDLDGTLLDSMHVWENVDVEFLSKRGVKMPPDYLSAVCALSFAESAEYTIRRFGLPDSADELMHEWNEMAARAYGHAVTLKPYAREYLIALKARGVRLGIATSLPAALYEPALKHHEIINLFDAICSSSEVGCGKSRPDIFLLAAQKLGMRPADCIVFEDIYQAIESAKSVGMTAYAVYDEASKSSWDQIKKIADGALLDFKSAPLPE